MHVLTPILEAIETITDSFSNDNSTIGLLSKTTTSHVHYAFLCISLPLLRGYMI